MQREGAARLDAWVQGPQPAVSTGTVTAFTRRKTGTGARPLERQDSAFVRHRVA
jgi:hypothetical protein